MSISRLERVELRELWRNEAYDFTTWLAENLDLLGERLGIELSLVQREASAGPFSADILAEDGNGNLVVIENQLERTDHDHLGKLITYLSNLDARAAIWITSDPRPEHEQAIHWLNEIMPAEGGFYLLKLEAYRIADSPPAPYLVIVAGPSLEAQQIGAQKKELAERHRLRLEFWRQLLERAKRRTNLHSQRSPTTENYLGTGAGRSGLGYAYVIRGNDAYVQLTIETGMADENKRIFDALSAHQDGVNQAFGDLLEWHRMDNQQMSKVRFVVPGGGLRDQDRWPEIQEKMIDAMVRLERALKPEVEKL